MADKEIELVNVVPPNVFVTHKKIFNDATQTFEDFVFYGVKKNSHSDAEAWLKKTYGPSNRYGQAIWWTTMEFVVMQDKIYTHYALSRKA